MTNNTELTMTPLHCDLLAVILDEVKAGGPMTLDDLHEFLPLDFAEALLALAHSLPDA